MMQENVCVMKDLKENCVKYLNVLTIVITKDSVIEENAIAFMGFMVKTAQKY